MYAQRQDVAVVGAKILYPDDSIYHGGIVLGIRDSFAFAYQGYDKDAEGYMGRLYYAHNISAVTGGCLMIETNIFNELSGFDTLMDEACRDVDLCLKARKQGYLNILNPYCVIYNCGAITKKISNDTFDNKWIDRLKRVDPYYNPNFDTDKANYSIK